MHAALEDLLDDERGSPGLERAYRVLVWRILAARGGPGLTGRLAALACAADTLEEYEVARDAELGPIISGLESGENRDP
jgi:hypothetical protein